MSLRPFVLLTIALTFVTSFAQAETGSSGRPAKSRKKTHYLELVSSTPAAKAKPKSRKASKKHEGAKRLQPNAAVQRPTTGNLQREVVFDGSTVNGQYHSAGEAVAKVEQEKKMNDLIGMRRDFKDRMASEKERLKRGDETAAN